MSSIEFQILNWWAKDELNDLDDSDNSDELEESKYTIYCFGKTQDNKNVTCKIINFYPFYYIKVIDKKSLNPLINFIKHKMYKKKDSLLEHKCEVVYKKDIFGFRNDKLYTFIKLVFKNITDMNKSKYFFKNPIKLESINRKEMKYKLYESSFDPYLKFCHVNDIQTANWVSISGIKPIEKKIVYLLNLMFNLNKKYKKSQIIQLQIFYKQVGILKYIVLMGNFLIQKQRIMENIQM